MRKRTMADEDDYQRPESPINALPPVVILLTDGLNNAGPAPVQAEADALLRSEYRDGWTL